MIARWLLLVLLLVLFLLLFINDGDDDDDDDNNSGEAVGWLVENKRTSNNKTLPTVPVTSSTTFIVKTLIVFTSVVVTFGIVHRGSIENSANIFQLFLPE